MAKVSIRSIPTGLCGSSICFLLMLSIQAKAAMKIQAVRKTGIQYGFYCFRCILKRLKIFGPVLEETKSKRNISGRSSLS